MVDGVEICILGLNGAHIDQVAVALVNHTPILKRLDFRQSEESEESEVSGAFTREISSLVIQLQHLQDVRLLDFYLD